MTLRLSGPGHCFFRSLSNPTRHLVPSFLCPSLHFLPLQFNSPPLAISHVFHPTPGALSCTSVSSLTETCVKVLVTAFKETILAECPIMIKNNETTKLNMMFGLMDRVPDGIIPMLEALEEHIKSDGLADMVAAREIVSTDSEKYVEQLLLLFERYSELAAKAFNDDPRFLTARDKAYRHVVNDTQVFRLDLPVKPGVGGGGGSGSVAKPAGSSAMATPSSVKTQPESKCPELLANYCDMLLRKTMLSKRLTSEEVEKRLKDVLLVLKYVQNKDVFMR